MNNATLNFDKSIEGFMTCRVIQKKLSELKQARDIVKNKSKQIVIPAEAIFERLAVRYATNILCEAHLSFFDQFF